MMNVKLKHIFFTLVFLLTLSATAFPQSGISPVNIERAGQVGWQFLKINGDARQAAMGSAFTAIAKGDAGGVFGNPAVLTDVKNIDVQINALQWIADIDHQSIAVAYNLGEIGVVGASVVRLGYGDIPETINTSLGSGGTTPLVTGNYFTANDFAAGLCFARKITDRLSLGGNIRWIQQKIANYSMSNWSFDIGTIYYTGFRSLRLAIVARNFGPDSRFGGWSEEYQSESDNVRMPLDFRAGIAMDFFDEPGSTHLLTVVAEGDHPNDGKEKIHLGASYSYDGLVVLRCGYKFNYDVQRFTFGVGVNYVFGGVASTINYAYVDFGELTQVHMFSIGFSF